MNGILVIDKPGGWSSHDVVLKVRRILREKRIGHTGTLDPLATGVLVLCIGKATRLVRYLEGEDKEYIAELRLGSTTDTQDAEGRVLETREYTPPAVEQIVEVLGSFQGSIRQRPPAFSALKVNGVPSYRLARKGTLAEHRLRSISIHTIRLLGYADPVVTFSVCCSKGTYVRTLCSDIGARLGMGAHLISLVRTRAGRFPIGRAMHIGRIEELAVSGRIEQELISLSDAVSGFPQVILDEEDCRRICHGKTVPLPAEAGRIEPQEGPLRILNEKGIFLAMAQVRNGQLQPEVVLA